MTASTVRPPVWSRGVDGEQVAALVARGMGQWEASLLVFGPESPSPEPPVPPAWDAPPAAWSSWVARHVHVVFGPLRKAVGLR